ncbi:hypothetical protein EVA_20777, partial [gut metagenome]
ASPYFGGKGVKKGSKNSIYKYIFI